VAGLFIRYDTSDTGSRPIPAGTKWWLSPDVRLCRGGNPTDTAIVNVDHQIRVLVRNRDATQRTNAIVEVWPCRFGPVPKPLASFPPAGYRRTACSVLATPSDWDATPCSGIGTIPPGACTVPPGGAAWFETNWTPLQSDIDDLRGEPGKTEAHCCLIANCYADGDGSALQRDGNGGILHHDVPGEARHAQHNITVAQSALGGWKLKIWAANMFEQDATFVLNAREVPFRRLPERFRLQGLELRERLAARGTRFAPLTRRVPDLGGLLHRLPGGPIVRDVHLDVDGRRGGDVPVRIAAGRVTPVDLNLEVTRPGWSRVDVVQRDAEGNTIGGARVVLLGLPRQVIREISDISVLP
jgi:hypothetical protein